MKGTSKPGKYVFFYQNVLQTEKNEEEEKTVSPNLVSAILG
jgi:hypothetical protein